VAAGHIFAFYQLARAAERSGDVKQAIGWYEKLLADPERFRSNYLGTSPSTLLIATRLLAPGAALASPAGQTALADLAAQVPDFAKALGEVNLCTTCGGAIDLGQAANWLRLAGSNGDQSARYTLSRLVKKLPELANAPDEASVLLSRNVEPPDDDTRLFGYSTDIASYLTLQSETGAAGEEDAAFAQRMAGVLDALCAKQPDDCENAGRDSAPAPEERRERLLQKLVTNHADHRA